MTSDIARVTNWDPSQQMQLEKGLAANSANLKNASIANIKIFWKNIAAGVDKKSARECHDRFFYSVSFEGRK